MALSPKAAHLEALGERGKSLDDIAAMMEEARKTMSNSPNEGNEDGNDAEDVIGLEEAPGDEEENALDEPEKGRAGEADADGDVAGDEGSAEEAEAQPEADEGVVAEAGTEENTGEFELSDDVLVELEGLDEPVSFKDLREVYEADKTIKERIVQHDAALDEALKTRAKAVEDATELNNAMQVLVAGLETAVATPLIGPPPDGLKAADPQRYIEHLEAYQNDQQRIINTRNEMLAALDTHTNKVKENKAERRAQAMAKLASNLEPLRNEKTKQAASKDILAAAEHYGFSPNEVNEADDHRMFMMAYDAQQYRKLMAQSAEDKDTTVTVLKQKAGQQSKVLRTKGNTQRLTSAQKRVKVTASTAAKTGKTEDVSAFMAAKRQAKRA